MLVAVSADCRRKTGLARLPCSRFCPVSVMLFYIRSNDCRQTESLTPFFADRYPPVEKKNVKRASEDRDTSEKGSVFLSSLPYTAVNRTETFSRKEVFQPHLPVRLPCYDLAPVTSFTLGRSLRLRTSGTPSFHGLTGGVYKARERIHRAVADARLLANPASRSRVADFDPN